MRNLRVYPSTGLSLLSGLMIGLSVNHGVNLAFLLPVCMLGVFIALERSADWKSWMLHGWVFSLAAMSLALLGFAWVELVAGSIMILVGSVLFTLPFMALFVVRRWLGTTDTWSLALLGLIWPPHTWFIKEHLLGFPITLFDISLSNYPVFIQFMSVTGATAAASWVIVLNVLVLQVARSTGLAAAWHQKRSVRVALVLVWFSLPLLYAAYAYSVLPRSFTGSVTAAVIQPGFPDPLLDPDSEESQQAMLFRTLELSEAALADTLATGSRPELLVWPEGELPFSIRHDPEGLTFIADRVLRWQTSLITGLSDVEPVRGALPPLQAYLGRDYLLYNAVAMVTPQLAWRVLMENESAGALHVYRKVNRMPFTEYVPGSERFPRLSELAMEYGEHLHLSAGTSAPPLAFFSAGRPESSSPADGRVIRVLPYICWDILFPSTHTAGNLRQAQLITAHTSGRLFGRDLKTSLLGMKNYTRLRSVEARKSIINSASTGYSFFTNPFGEVNGVIDPFTSGYSVGEVPLSQTLTLYHRFPHAFPGLCVIFLILLVVLRRSAAIL
ncbi:MAG: apolipoprotein N-acyltransferase [Bacteroidetes bacterium HLUCCA01]|nr:MAG: apolipoprotein N-acyltransferase [Bacteroidetes bacterium HLUCCA01]